MARGDLLNEALDIINERGADYGDQLQTAQNVADAMNALFGLNMQAHHVPAFNVVQKLQRMRTNPAKRDNWADIAGYADMGAQCLPIEWQQHREAMRKSRA